MTYRKATLPPVEACAICKRRPSMGHAADCDGGATPPVMVVPGRASSLAQWAAEEAERRRSGRTSAGPVGRTTPSAAPGASKSAGSGPTSTLIIDPDALEALVVDPDAGACFDCGAEIQADRFRCITCTRANGKPKRLKKERTMAAATIQEALANVGIVPSPIDNTQEGRICAECGVPKPMTAYWRKRNGEPQATCSGCGSAKLAAARALRSKPAPVAEPPIDTSTTVEHQADSPAPSPSCAPQTQGPDLSGQPRTLAQLRIERDDVAAYLAKLDQEIEQAEILERFSHKTNDELAAMLEETRRQARMLELALGGRVA